MTPNESICKPMTRSGELGQLRVLEREMTRAIQCAKASGGGRVGNLVVGESRTEAHGKSGRCEGRSSRFQLFRQANDRRELFDGGKEMDASTGTDES